MDKKIVTFFINLLIAAAIFLFSLSLSYILSIMLFRLQVTSVEVNSALISIFVTGVVTSLSISVKNLLNKDKEPDMIGYLFVAKVTAILVAGMMILRYLTMVG